MQVMQFIKSVPTQVTCWCSVLPAHELATEVQVCVVPGCRVSSQGVLVRWLDSKMVS